MAMAVTVTAITAISHFNTTLALIRTFSKSQVKTSEIKTLNYFWSETLVEVFNFKRAIQTKLSINKQIGSLLKLQTMATKKWRKNSNEKPVLHFNTK